MWALRGKLAAVNEHAIQVALHEQDWAVLGLPAHMPVEVALARLEALERVVDPCFKASADVLLAIACLRARLVERGAVVIDLSERKKAA